jgi:hypothetical protein
MKTLQRCCSVLLLISTVAAAGCATHDRRDTAYDPRISEGRSLFDQMPNWQQQCGVTVKCQ